MRCPRMRSILASSAMLVGLVVSAPTSPAGATTAPPTDTAVAYQGDPAHDGVGGTLPPPLTRGWSAAVKAVSAPVIVNGRAYVTVATSGGGSLIALDLVSGATLWQRDIGGQGWVTYDGGQLFALNTAGFLAAINPADGTEAWGTQLSGQWMFSSAPTAAGGMVYTSGAGTGGTVYAVSEATGQLMWTASVMNGDDSAPAVVGGEVYVSYACNQAYAFDATTGALTWHHNSSCEGGGGATVAVNGGKVYTRDGIVGNAILDAATGTQVDTYNSGTIPAFDSAHAYLVSGGVLTARNLTTGLTDWTSSANDVLSAPITSGGRVYVGTSVGVRAVDAATGKQIWGDALPGGATSQSLVGLAVGGGYLLVPTTSSLVAYRVSQPGEFIPLTPSRVLDTRNSIGASGPLQPSATVHLTVAGNVVPGVPIGASAVVLNLTASQPSAGGFITAYPTGANRPDVSNLNFVAGQTVPNLAVVPLGTGGQVDLFNGSSGTVQLLADVFGYFVGGTPTAAGAFTPVGPSRLMDTRINLGARGPVPAHGVVSLQVAGGNSPAPSTASAVVLNVTVTRTKAAGYITAYPAGSPVPPTSNLNFGAAQTRPNLVVVPVGTNGSVDLGNYSTGSVDMIADIAGYYVGGATPAGHMFAPLNPARLLDTRSSSVSPGPIAGNGTAHLQVTGGTSPVPDGAVAVVLNVTATAPGAAGYITAYPDGMSLPVVSNLNFVKGQTIPNLVTVPIGADGQVDLYNGSSNSVQLIADVYGYYLGG